MKLTRIVLQFMRVTFEAALCTTITAIVSGFT